MLTKFEVLETIVRTGALLIARLDSADEAYRVAEAAIEGGIRAVEIPLTVPGALGVIERLADKYADQGIVVGAGTVLDAEAAYAAVSAGARLLVSPQLNPNMIAAANRYQAVTASGAFTPTEVLNTLEAGADIVKLFPAELGGPRLRQDRRGPAAAGTDHAVRGSDPGERRRLVRRRCDGRRRRQLRHQGCPERRRLRAGRPRRPDVPRGDQTPPGTSAWHQIQIRQKLARQNTKE